MYEEIEKLLSVFFAAQDNIGSLSETNLIFVTYSSL